MVHLAILLIVEYIFFLIFLRGLSYYSVIYPNLQEGKHFSNSLSKYCSKPGGLFLMFCRILIFLFLSSRLLLTYYLGSSVEWNHYSSFILCWGTFYFLMVSIYSVRKAWCCRLPDVHYPLLDPRLSSMVNSIFNLLVPVALVSSALSVFMHREVVYTDHVVTLACVFEMLLNTFRVGGGDVFLCISFALLHIGFVWVTSAFLELSDWPHNMFKMKTQWCAVTYNVFIFAHLVAFVLYFVLMKYIFSTPVVKAKVLPKDNGDEFTTLPNSDNGDENMVEILSPNSGGGDDSNLLIQDIESSRPQPEPEPEPEPEPKPPVSTLSDEQEAALVAQMIAERNEKKRVLAEAEGLKLEVQELKERNARDHVKLEKVVGRLSERDLQLKDLEGWLSAKNDEELAKIKMQMADKLNDLSLMHRPKSARGGEVALGHTSALLDMDAKAPVQTKNLQALSTLRKMKSKKFTKVDDDITDSTTNTGDGITPAATNFNMYKTL